MENKEKFVFEIEFPIKQFDRHLKISGNNRIIVSAPFGAGKTYFLKEFFKDNSKYEVIHLFPVNYSVASNEDIFELLKYDILFELLGKNLEFETLEFSKMDFLPFFLKNNIKGVLDVFSPFLTHMPVVGKSLYGISEKLKSLFKNFSKKAKDIQIDEKASVIDYLESFTDQKGSIFEEDFYSQLILQLVNQLKASQSDTDDCKETVLIIDDLDRVDPDHIFRILNVLSAQIDKVGTNNKFGFDKIILVFDQCNVRNIFKNRYGANVDYVGYIDKFYSHVIFEFKNFVGLKDAAIKLFNEEIIKGAKNWFLKFNENVLGVAFVFERLIESNGLTTRRLVKVLSSDYHDVSKKRRFYFQDIEEIVPGYNLFVLFLVEFLLHVFEDWDELLTAVEEARREIYIDNFETLKGVYRVIGECLILLDIKQNKLSKDLVLNGSERLTYTHKASHTDFLYTLNYDPSESLFYSDCILKNNNKDQKYFPPVMSVLYDTLLFIKNEGLKD